MTVGQGFSLACCNPEGLSNTLPLPVGGCVEIAGDAMLVILNPSPFVTRSEAKGLVLRLRINSVKIS